MNRDQPPPATSTTGQPSWMAPVTPVVPDHELIRRIGGGSYGDVWLARNVIGTWRAVKVVFRDRFLDAHPYDREFHGIQKFEPLSRSNEGFIDILQIGRNDTEGYFYYVMELADSAEPGTTVAAESPDPASYVPKTLAKVLLQRGRLPVNECLELGLTLNLGLSHLHKAGLIHRDIKPSNLIFVGGVPKLADIGLVIEASEARSYVGTEGFIPPEGPNSPQADLFSLGKVLYEAGMGKDRKDFPEPLSQIAEAPDSAQLLEFNAILLKACAANVRERYQSADEMNADLALLQSGGSVRRQRKLAGQLRFVQRAGAIVTALAAVIALGWWWQARQTHFVRELVVEKTLLADANSQLAADNRERIVRLDIANGVRLLDDNDPSAALLWFADALPLVTNNPDVADIHRIRIQQTLQQTPRLLRLFGDEASVFASAFSPDGLRLATLTRFTRDNSRLTMRDVQTGQVLWELRELKDIRQLRFARDGRRLFLWSSDNQGRAGQNAAMTELQIARVVEVQTGKSVFAQLNSNLHFSAFSSDDRWLAAALTNHTIQLFDTRDGHLVVELRGHTKEISMLAFSDDGSLLASGSDDQSARIWRLPSGEPVGGPFAHARAVRRVALSADGRCLATATAVSEDSPSPQIQVWDVQAGEKLGAATTENGPARALFFSPSGSNRLFASGDADDVRVWDVGSSVTLRRTLKFPGVVRCWDFSADGQLLALGTDSGFVSLWNTETWELLFPPFRHTGWVESVHFSPDAARLLTTSDDGTAKVWSLRRTSETTSLRLSPDIRGFDDWSTHGLIPMAMEDGWLHVVDTDRLVDVQTLMPRQTNAPMEGFTAGTTGRYWALAEPQANIKSPGRLTLWKRDGKAFSWREITLPEPEGLRQFNVDDSRLASVRLLGPDRIIHIWRTSDGTLERSIPVPDSLQFMRWDILPRPFDLSFRTLLAYGVDPSGDGFVQAFGLASRQFTGQPFTVKKLGGGDRITRMCLSPDGTRLASVGHDQKGTIVDLQTGKLAVPQFKHGGSLFHLDWSPDGKRLLTVGFGVKMWDTSTGEMLGAPMVGERFARWSADGRFIATRTEDNRARVWDATTTEPVTPFLPHSDYIAWVCITANNRLITTSSTNLLRAWDLKPNLLPADVIADYAKLLSGRALNASGVLLPIPAKDLMELDRSLRSRVPQLFE